MTEDDYLKQIQQERRSRLNNVNNGALLTEEDYLKQIQQERRSPSKSFDAQTQAKPEVVEQPSQAIQDFESLSPLKKGVAMFDNAYSQLRDVAGDAALNVAKVAQGAASATGLYDALDIPEQTVMQSAQTLRNFIAPGPKSEEGKKLRDAMDAKMQEYISKSSTAGDAIQAVSEFYNDTRDYLVNLTGSEVTADGLLAAPQVAFDFVVPLMAPVKGAKASLNPTAKEIRIAAEQQPSLAKRLATGVSDSASEFGRAAYYRLTGLENPSAQTLQELRKLTTNAVNDRRSLIRLRDNAYDQFKTVPIKRDAISNLRNDINNLAEQGNVDLAGLGILSRLNKAMKNYDANLLARGANKKPYSGTVGDLLNFKKQIYKNYDVATPEAQRGITLVGRQIDNFIASNLDSIVNKRVFKTPESREKLLKQITFAKQVAKQAMRNDELDLIWREASFDTDPLGYIQKKVGSLAKNHTGNTAFDKRIEQLMREVSTNTPMASEDGKIKKLVKLAGYSSTAGIGRFFVKFARAYRAKRAITGEPIQGAIIAPARFLDGLVFRTANKSTKAYKNLVQQVRLGEDGVDMVKRYLKAVPKSKRDFAELGTILAESNVDLRTMKFDKTVSRLQREAVEYAKGVRNIYAAAALATTPSVESTPPQEEEENASIH